MNWTSSSSSESSIVVAKSGARRPLDSNEDTVSYGESMSCKRILALL